MKREERSYLKNIKSSNGMSHKEADESIFEFENSQKKFKILNKNLKKQDTIIRNLEKKLEKKDEQIEKLKEKKSSSQKPKINKKSNKGKEVFLKDIENINKKELKKRKLYTNRIKNNIEYGKSYTKTDFKVEFMIPNKIIDWAINTLIKEGKIYSRESGRSMRYFKK